MNSEVFTESFLTGSLMHLKTPKSTEFNVNFSHSAIYVSKQRVKIVKLKQNKKNNRIVEFYQAPSLTSVGMGVTSCLVNVSQGSFIR